MIKLGLAGMWHVHFGGYVKEFLSRGDVEITALWDPDETAAKEKAEELGAEYTTDLDKFYQMDFDTVMVCAATNIHKEVLIKAANAKKNIFTEKVLTSSYSDALEVKKAVAEAGIKFCISFPWRTRADFMWIKKAVDEGLVGQVTYMRMRNAHDGVSRGWLPPSFLDPVPTCGGAMMDLGAHGMYLLNWIMGEPEKCTSVFTNCLCDSVEDNCVTAFSYKNGAIGVSETGFVTGRNPFQLEIAGTKGTILAGGMFDKVHYNNGDGWVYPDVGRGSKSSINSLCDSINGDGEPLFGIDDAVSLTKTMEMAYKNII